MADGQMRPPGRAVCRRCGLQLNPQTHYEGDRVVEVSWHHGYDADHEPDPQPVDVVPTAAMVCDFCGRPGPVWSFETDGDIVLHTVRDTPHGPEPMISTADNAWAACEGCARLITADRRTALWRRAADRLGDATPGRLAGIRDAHDSFFAAGPRPPVRLDGGHTTTPSVEPIVGAGPVVDRIVDLVTVQRRRLTAVLPEAGPLTQAFLLAALADRPPQIPDGLLESLLSRPHRRRFAGQVVRFASLVAATRLWRTARISYVFDRDLAARLGELAVDFEFPLDMLRRLPHPNPFLTFPEPLHLPRADGRHQRVVGAFLTGTHLGTGTEPGSGPSAGDYVCGTHSAAATALKLTLCGPIHDQHGPPVLLADGTPDMVVGHLPIPTHGQRTIAAVVDFALANMNPPERGDRDDRADVTAMLRRALTLLAYVCSRTADLNEQPAQRPRTSKKGKRAAQRRRAPAQVVQVGYRIGAQLRAYEQRRVESNPAGQGTGTGRTVPPHIRRMHPHQYRVGPGRNQTELRWLDPIPVNMNGPAEQTTVIPVPPEQSDPPPPAR